MIRGRTGTLSLLMAACVLSSTCAEEGAAQIGRAINDLTTFLSQEPARNLPHLVRNCYEKRPADGGVDNLAYCFAIDYGASQLDEALASRTNATPQPYLRIEKVLTRANRALSAIKIEQDERGPLIAFWANSSRAMLTHWATSDSSAVSPSGPILDQAKTAVLRLVKEPGQARVAGLELRTTPNMRGEPTQVVCGRVSERMPTGTYTPYKTFVYFVRDQSVNYDNGKEDLDREVVKNFCARDKRNQGSGLPLKIQPQ